MTGPASDLQPLAFEHPINMYHTTLLGVLMETDILHCSFCRSFLLNFVSDVAKTLRSSTSRLITFELIGFDILYPSVELSFQATGFRNSVNSCGRSASPWGSPLLKWIGWEVFSPRLVWTTIFVFQLSHKLRVTPHTHNGNLCTCMIFFNHPWSTESWAFSELPMPCPNFVYLYDSPMWPFCQLTGYHCSTTAGLCASLLPLHQLMII